ncbi:hypothetical protein SARI_01260 [Salmonella enterica subsp. arizonae serovar 62:z4,z23:-]|uniref:EAL domain-containing protein n=1 Tax=Salmonella arizonae (strain ATCC BAA-731 / CDC346-86 / RSK2980) TaxID=41514 RepID=A9MQ18_SALAR|nr:hypothetical protein SARI_01260 [Salmonella enterica subsp. arizonae serovar 62:z4,z23:-]
MHELNFDYCPIDVELTESCLIKNGINERQGFLFAKPMPAVSFERWYKRYLAKKCINDGIREREQHIQTGGEKNGPSCSRQNWHALFFSSLFRLISAS